jgi:hypothetical protein
MNTRKTKFVPPIKHPLDLRSLRQMRDAVNALLNGQVIAGKTGQLHYSDSNIIVELPTPEIPAIPMHPFEIYQPAVPSFITTGITFLGTNGVPTVCNISASVPTDFGSSPPNVNPSTDAWRFWAVRSGLVELRPLYIIDLIQNITTPNGSVYGLLMMADNTDGNGIADSSTTTTQTPPLIFSGNPSFGDNSTYEFWLQILPDALNVNQPAPNVIIVPRVASAFSGILTAATNTYIPLGVVIPAPTTGAGPIIENIIRGNVTGRFGAGNSNFGNGGVMNFRGTYQSNNSIYLPADLNSQLFYPGDVVTITSTSLPNSMYEFVANYPAFWPEAPSFGTNWKQIL